MEKVSSQFGNQRVLVFSALNYLVSGVAYKAKQMGLGVLVMGFALHAFSANSHSFLINDDLIHEIIIEKVHEDHLTFSEVLLLGLYDSCNKDLRDQPDIELKQSPSSGSIIDGIRAIDLIVNTGERIWKIVEKNQPVVNWKSHMASALPQGTRCWDELSNWKAPIAKTYKISYHNLFRMKVVEFSFRVIYTHGGDLDGAGQYLTNSTILYRNLDVAWAYNFDALVEIPRVVNLGSKEDPIAGMQMNINWNVSTAMKNSSRAVSFFVYGDGRPVKFLN